LEFIDGANRQMQIEVALGSDHPQQAGIELLQFRRRRVNAFSH
jgi:hypothetical protein